MLTETEAERLTAPENVTDLARLAEESAANEPRAESERVWYLYVLQCADRSLYCGIALNVQKRLAQHQRGRGAKYTRARLPVTLLSSTVIGPDIAKALKAERQFKAMPRAKKLKVLKAGPPVPGKAEQQQGTLR